MSFSAIGKEYYHDVTRSPAVTYYFRLLCCSIMYLIISQPSLKLGLHVSLALYLALVLLVTVKTSSRSRVLRL